MKAIGERMGARDMVEIRIPDEDMPHQRWPVLQDVPSMVYDGSIPEVVEFIDRQDWYSRAIRPRLPELSAAYAVKPTRLRFGIRADLGPFKELDAPGLFISQRGRVFPGELYYFAGEVDSQRVQLQININPHRTALGEIAIAEEGDADDRAVFKAYRHFANEWIEAQDARTKGIHLVFRDDQQSHLGVTTIADQAVGGRRDWERRYAVLLRDPEGGEAGELDLAFMVRLPADDDEGSFRQFCRLTWVFDSTVASLVYRPRHSLWQPEALRVVAAKSVLLALALAVRDYVSTQFLSTVAHVVTTAILGAVAMDVLLALNSRNARRDVDLTGMMFGPKTRLLPTYGRLLDQLWNLIVGSVVYGAVVLATGLINPVSLVAIAYGAFTKIVSPWFWGLVGAGVYLLGELGQRQLTKSKRAWN
jgi:hypothetical protein